VKYLTRAKEFCSYLLYYSIYRITFYLLQIIPEGKQPKRKKGSPEKRRKRKRKACRHTKQHNRKSHRKKQFTHCRDQGQTKPALIIRLYNPVVTAKRIKLIDSTRVLKI